MASKVKYEAVATIGTYKDRQTGEEKKQYQKVGIVFENEEGKLSLKLDVIPVGPNWSGYISFYDPKPRDGQGSADRAPQGARSSEYGKAESRSSHQNGAAPPARDNGGGSANDPDDDIPFHPMPVIPGF